MSIWADILTERARQEELKRLGRFEFSCADDGLNDFERLAVLAEEVGEVSHNLNEAIGRPHRRDVQALRAELIQVAAVCVAWVENIDKRK